MAAKVKLGARPKDFKHTVTAPLPEGGEGTIEVTYLYRTRTEFGKFVDEQIEANGMPPAAGQTEEEKFTMLRLQMQTRDANAAYIMGICSGWNLDFEFTRANVEQLCDELPGMAVKIIDDYRAAILEGRLGN
jgi:hypothetical protein